jgi:hypothetical protein
MYSNGLHQNHFGKASRRGDVPLTVSKRSFIRFTFWMDQELAMLEARWGSKYPGEEMQIDMPRCSFTDPPV